MLRISKIVSCKSVETLQELLYTALANNFNNSAPAYTRNTMSPVLFLSIARAKRASNEGEALVILVVLLGLVIFDETSTTLLPVRTYSAPRGLHDPRIVDPDETIKRKETQMVPLYSYYLAGVIQRSLKHKGLSLPIDHWTAKRERGRAPPLRI